MTKLRIGLIDSGVAGYPVVASRSFLSAPGGGVFCEDAMADQLGHGSAMAGILLEAAPDVALYNAQVFATKLTCSAVQVAAALSWLVEQGVQLVNMSFGLREDRPVLREACERAVDAGVILVAAAPARGEPVYPANYPEVIRATGDARCAQGEISFLDSAQADFGGHVRTGNSLIAGASVGCANVSAGVVQCLARSASATPQQIRVHLSCMATYRGPERRAG